MKKSMKTWQEEIRNNDNNILLFFEITIIEIIIICLQHMLRIQTHFATSLPIWQVTI